MGNAPSADDMHTAAQWLDVYESDGTDSTEADACQRVRHWLLEQADAQEFREACRAAGVPVAAARKSLKALKKGRQVR